MTASLKQKFLKLILDLYLYPIKLNTNLKRYVLDVTLMDASERLCKPIMFLKSNKLIGKKHVIIDIGGANGETTSVFLKSIPHCIVYTFEVIPELALKIENRFINRRLK